MLLYGAAALLTAFSTAALLYVSLATGTGPWIAPVLVMVVRLIAGFGGVTSVNKRSLAALIIISSTGGAIATGIGFSLPTLYFIDKAVWDAWMQAPLFLWAALGVIVIVAGGTGIIVARRVMRDLSQTPDVAFPISAATNAMIETDASVEQGAAFSGGIIAACLAGLTRLGAFMPAGSLVCVAAGFLAGTSLLVPLLVGFASKYALVPPLVQMTGLTTLDVSFAVCTGLLASSIVRSLVKAVRGGAWRLHGAAMPAEQSEWLASGGVALLCMSSGMSWIGSLFFAGVLPSLLQHLGTLAARTGLATYGRYMTVVMLPLLCIPGVSPYAAIVACVLVGVAGGAAVETIFSYKIAERWGIEAERVGRLQWIGLFITALLVGGVFWLLCSRFPLGVPPLMAHRGISRALLMKAFTFNGWLVLLGIAYGIFLDWWGVNAALVFGGIIMPESLVVALASGAGIRAITGKKTTALQFWCGVLAGDALWLIVSMLC